MFSELNQNNQQSYYGLSPLYFAGSNWIHIQHSIQRTRKHFMEKGKERLSTSKTMMKVHLSLQLRYAVCAPSMLIKGTDAYLIA